MVEAQQAKEAEIRKRVSSIQQRLLRGLHVISALVASEVEEFRVHIASVATVLLEGVLPRAGTLIGDRGFETYLVRSHFSELHIYSWIPRISANAALNVLLVSMCG